MARKVANPGVGTGHGVRPKRDFICADCGEVFQAARSDALRCKKCNALRQSRMYESRQRKDTCPDCGKQKHVRARYCQWCSPKHSSEQRRRHGADNHMWKGGRTRHTDGYIEIRVDGKRRLEHILVWEAAHGPVPKNWNIHHLNGVKDGNRLENLVAMSRSDHHRNHHTPWEDRIRELESRIRELEG